VVNIQAVAKIIASTVIETLNISNKFPECARQRW